MFRLFLRKKLLDGDSEEAKEVQKASSADSQRNRRIFERYNIDHKHLTLMNEQDIFLIREISAKGFSTEVSDRGYERLNISDYYEARIRYLGEIYDLKARVAWKSDNFVGFEIVEADRPTLLFIKRLLKPIEIASSLQLVDANFVKETSNGKAWYHGDNESDLYTWHDNDNSNLTAWQLSVGESYVEWNSSDGFQTGSLKNSEGKEALMGANLQGLTHDKDKELDPEKRQLAVDIIMALQHPVREEILDTITR
jgi:hypothetical protein